MPKPAAESAPAKKAAPKIRVPASLGGCADRLFAIQETELPRLRKAIEALEAEESAIEAYLIDNLPKSRAEGIVGRVGRAVVDRVRVPSVKDWDALRKYIVKTKGWDLIQKRISSAAVKERWEAKLAVPGVVAFPVVKVRVSKR